MVKKERNSKKKLYRFKKIYGISDSKGYCLTLYLSKLEQDTEDPEYYISLSVL